MLAKFLSVMAVLSAPFVALASDYQIIERPRQECWNEQQVAQPSGYGGAIIGGLTGGLLGNQIGGGNGRTAATAVGAATGAVVGDRLSGAPNYRNVQHCRTVVDRERVPVYRDQVIEQRVYYADGDNRYYDHDHDRHRKHHRHHRDHDHEDDDD